MSYYRVELIDYSDYNWNIEILYKNQYITTLNREEFQKLIGLYVVSSELLEKKYDLSFFQDRCELTHPFEVNAHIYNILKLKSLRALLNNQYDEKLEAWMKSTLDFEKEQYEIFKQASKKEEFNQYFESLNNEENTLKFVLRELNVEKIVDLRFVKNINLIYDEYLSNTKKRSDEIVARSGRTDNLYADYFQEALNFRPKYDNILKKILEIEKI